jgi:predicted transcriptional regulator YdeE
MFSGQTIDLAGFNVTGVSVRTTNQGGQSTKDIGALWVRFMSQNYIEQIPNKETTDIYCVYTDYESDLNGPYTAIIGCKVRSLENIPQGFISTTIPATTYAVFTSEGKIPESIAATWRLIWQSDINRKYMADFDVYSEKARNPEDAIVETFISISS